MDSPDPSDDRLARRRVLALSAGLLGSLAGCSGGGDETPTPDPTATDAPTGTPTASPTSSPTPSPTASPSPTPTASPTATPTPAGLFAEPFGTESPSSMFAPADGFASTEWLTGTDPEVVRVTNLDASGEGSLRAALNRDAPTVVAFEVGGVIDLEGQHLHVNSANTFVAGQTAPSPGITVIRGALLVESHNVLVQHLRVRPGDRLVEGPREGDPAGSATDAMSVSDGTPNVIFDHCSAAWGTDEVMSSGGGLRNARITFTNNIIAEGLDDSLHHKGPHSKGTLIMDNAKEVALAGNLWAHNADRHPRLKGGTTSVVVNNMAYNHGDTSDMGTGSQPATASYVGNVYRAGPDSPGTGDPPMVEGLDAGRAYMAFNASQPRGREKAGNGITVLDEKPLWSEGLDSVFGSSLPDRLFPAVGARPADRTPHDERIIEEAKKREGRIIDSQTEVGGYPDIEATERTLDVPGTNLGGWLRAHTRAVELADADPP